MRILLVDDHSLIRSGVRDSLGKHYGAISIAEADSSKSMLALTGKNEFDIALIDLFIPGEQLFKVVRECCSNNPDLPVIVLSSSEQPAHIRKCIDLGVVGFISKSSPQTDLFQAIDTVLDGGTYFPSPVLEEGINEETRTGNNNALSLDYSTVSGVLTRRQMEILAMMARGQTNKEIARNLGLANDTVKVHVSAIFKSLGLSNRSQAAILGEKLGLSERVADD